MPISTTIVNYVIHSGEGVWTSDAQHDNRFETGNSIVQAGIREAMCVPMHGRYELMGVIYVDITTSSDELLAGGRPRHFSEELLALLLAIGRQSAMSVENFRYQQALEKGEKRVVGVNVHTGSVTGDLEILRVSHEVEREQVRLTLAATLVAALCQRLVPLKAGGVRAAVEVLINTPTVRKLILENKLDTLPAAVETSTEDGMQTFNQALLKLIQSGLVSEADGLAHSPAPEQLIPGSFASASLLARINTGKFADHLPLYRQEQIFARAGITLSRKTMCGWVWRTANWLRIIYEALRQEVLSAGYLQADETPVGYICPGHGKTRKGYLWVCLAPGKGVYFEWHTGRGADCVGDMLGKYEGTVQTDGYAAYESHNKSRPDGRRFKLGNCWAHARRKFHEAKAESALAGDMLKRFALESNSA